MVALGASLATAVWMVDRIHRHPAYVRALAQMAAAAGFANRNILVVQVADLPDSRAALGLHHPLLARGQLEKRELALFRHQLRSRPGAAYQLRASTGLELHPMHHCAERDVAQRERVARLDIGLRPRLDLVALLESFGRQDVALLAISVMQQRDIGRAIGIVLERRDHRRDAVVIALEIDQPEPPLMAATAMTRGHAAAIVASARMFKRREQPLLGRLGGEPREIGQLHEALTRGPRIQLYYRHCKITRLPQLPGRQKRSRPNLAQGNPPPAKLPPKIRFGRPASASRRLFSNPSANPR